MAREGIEYDWTFCKSKYRCRPLTEKKGIRSFQQLVEQITSWRPVAEEQSRRGSARARSYMSGYFNIHFENVILMNKGTRVLPDGVVVGGKTAPQVPPTQPWNPAPPGEVISMDMIKKIKKAYHSPRAVNSFQKGTHAVGSGADVP
jgi:hypothetical protein